MAEAKQFEIKINGIKDAIKDVNSLEEALKRMAETAKAAGILDNLTKTLSTVSSQTQKLTQDQKERNKVIQAENTIEMGLQDTYRQKQQLMSAMGTVIKNLNTADAEQAQRQQELIGKYNELNSELKAVDAQMGNHQRSVGDYTNAINASDAANVNLKQGVKDLTMELANMIANGVSKTSTEFKEMAAKAGEMKDALEDARAEVNRYASDTKKLDDVINLAQSATAAFELYKGAMSAFGLETKETEEAIQQLMGAMSIVQSLQQLSETLQNGSATAKLFQTALKLTGAELVVNQVNAIKAAAANTSLSTAQKAATVTSKLLGLAMKAIPLMFVIGLVASLITHWDDLCGWFDNTFPRLKKMGGLMNTLKATVMGLGKAILNWLVNPIKTFADVIKHVLAGDFSGAIAAVSNGIKNQFKGTAEAFKSGFQQQVEKGMESMSRKAASEMDKTLTHQKNMITKQKNADGTYRREYIEANRKMFENRKKMYKKDSEEYNRVLEEEAQFYQQVEDAKTSAAQKGATARAKIAQKANNDAQRAEEERQKRLKDYYDKAEEAEIRTAEAVNAENIRIVERELERYVDGPLDKYLHDLNILKELQETIAENKYIENYSKLWDSAGKDAQEFIEKLDELRETHGYLSADHFKEFSKLPEETQAAVTAYLQQFRLLETTLQNDFNAIFDNIKDKAIAATKNASTTLTNEVERAYKDLVDKMQGYDLSPVRDKLFGFVDKDKTLKKFENARKEWEKTYDEINNLIAEATVRWDEYVDRAKERYGEDSEKYKAAVQEKMDALKKLYDLQEEVAKRAVPAPSLDNDYNADNKPDVKGRKYTDASGRTDFSKIWKKDGELSENLQTVFSELQNIVLEPAMDTLSMFFDFAIEETEQRLEEVSELHDKALDKVNASADRIKELNDSLKDSSNTNKEVTKQQLADEQLLYAQRLAEEQKLLQQETNLKNKKAEQEAKARKLELGYQLVMGIANTALAATKAMSQFGYPLGIVAAAIMGTLGAIQTAMIAKQISQIRPVKYAEGGLLVGPSHSQHGIKVGHTGIEVEGGEAVINKASTQKYLPLLDAINAAGNGGKHTLMNPSQYNRMKKYANGGQLNFERIDSALSSRDSNRNVIRTIENLDMQPVVSVVDIQKVEGRLTRVRDLAGAGK